MREAWHAREPGRGFRPRLAATPLRFTNPSPPSGWAGDFHPQAIEPARHTKKSTAAVAAALQLSGGRQKTWLAKNLNGFLDVAVGLVDVFEGALLETLCEAVVFFLRDVAVSFVEQFDGAAQAARPVHASVNRRVIVDIFSVVDGGFLDFGDGVVDFVDGLLFLLAQFPAVGALQMSASLAQIA
jgi:hypothetical protein